MGLSQYKPQFEEIKLPKVGGEENSFKVRGLTLPDLTNLVQYHLGDLTKVVELLQQQKKDVFSKAAIGESILIVAKDMPGLCMEIISVCCDEDSTPELVKTITSLPFPVQMQALLSIVKLTVEESGGLKNLMAELQKLLVESLAAVKIGAPVLPTK